MGRKGEAVVEGIGYLRQFHIEIQRVQRLAGLVLLSQLPEIVGIDIVQPVALVAQVDAAIVAVAQLLGTLLQAPRDVKAVKTALVGLAHIEGQFLKRVVPGLRHLDVDAVVGGVEILELDAGCFWTIYSDYNKKVSYSMDGTNTYSRTNRSLGVGIDYKF